MKKTVCYYIPYSARAIQILRTIQNKYGAQYCVSVNEEVTITAHRKDIAKIEKMLAPII